MRFVAFEREQGRSIGVWQDGDIVDIGVSLQLTSMQQLLAGLKDGMGDVLAAMPGAPRYHGSEVTFFPPLANPGKAIAVGLNYVDHASESSFEPPVYPVLFQRFPSSWVGHEEPLERPLVSDQFDFEGELVVVIGKAGRNIAASDALGHVAGYSIFNDGSVRDFQFKSHQWMMGKNFDRSGAFGPIFVTADELPPGAKGLRLQTRLNGVVVQDANTRDMIFDVATLIATCSIAFSLSPGDIIIAGTPSGVGFARKPPLFMRAGDTCEVEIEGIGLLRNPVIDQPDSIR